MTAWIKKHRIEIIIVCLILLAASFLRFYRLPEYMTFLGDEGRDALVIKAMLVEHNLPFIGPPTSVGNIYLGPLYYYMMAVPMAVFWLNPVAAAGMVATIGVATVFLIYYLARQWFGILPAVLSALLYAISPVIILHSRSSWNPNPAPFFALLMVLGFYKSRQSKDYRWLVLSGAALAAAIQMHYLALILIPIFATLWLFERIKKRGELKHFLLGTVMAKIAFLTLILPLILFDLKHDFLNLRAIFSLFTPGGGSLSFNILAGVSRMWPIYIDDLIGHYLTGSFGLLAYIVAAALLVSLVTEFYRARRGETINWPYFALGSWLGIGIFGLSFYRGAIYDHYLGFVSPIPYLLLGSLAAKINTGLWKIGLAALGVVLLSVNFFKSPLLTPPGNQLARTQEIAKYVIKQSEGKPFNFALIAKSNYDSAYQFYLDQYGYKPEVLPKVTAGQLFVVCEDPVCNPIGHPKYEIAAFGWAKIERESEFLGVRVYKLVSNPDGKPL